MDEWWLDLGNPKVQQVLVANNWTAERWRKYLLDTTYTEPPVSMREFLYSPDYADYSDSLWPNVQVILEEFDSPQYREAYIGLGRGSGKSSIGAIFLARCLYWLMNLRDPWKYYALKKGTALNVINVSVSGAQAQSVIFDSLVNIVESSKWFKGKFVKRQSKSGADLSFEAKKVKAISGHSGSTAWRGYAIYAGVADEASHFISTSQKDNAADIVSVLKGSMQTRFERSYKLLVISSLKAQNDFVCKSLSLLRKEAKEKETMTDIESLKSEIGGIQAGKG